MSMFVHFVIGKFDFFKRNHLLPKLFSRIRRVWVRVYSTRCWRVSFSGNQPGWSMVRVPVPLIIYRNYVDQYRVPLFRTNARKRDPYCWKHPPAIEEHKFIFNTLKIQSVFVKNVTESLFYYIFLWKSVIYHDSERFFVVDGGENFRKSSFSCV